MNHDLFEFVARAASEEKRPFIALPYQQELCRMVEDCIFGQLPSGKRNLIIAIAPRTYKTTFTSRSIPPWAFGEVAPDCEFILTSATAALSIDNAIACKKTIHSQWYQTQYPFVNISSVDKDTQAHFKTTSGGSVYAVGLGGTITGYGAGKARDSFGGAIIIDDPLKADDAFSRAKRNKVIRYYCDTLKSRRNNMHSTPFILIAQRLHENDLTGYLLREEAKQWYVVEFPALDEKNNLLNPVTMSLEELENMRAISPHTFFAQYQQKPTADIGNMFKKNWWYFYNEPLFDFDEVIVTADTAEKTNKNNDRSCLQIWGRLGDCVYLLHMYHKKVEAPDLLAAARKFYELGKSYKNFLGFFIEDKSSGVGIAQYLRREGKLVRPVQRGRYNDKVSRVNTILPLVQRGSVYLPSFAPWLSTFLDELSMFKEDMTHSHDDIVDAAVDAINILLLKKRPEIISGKPNIKSEQMSNFGTISSVGCGLGGF